MKKIYILILILIGGCATNPQQNMPASNMTCFELKNAIINNQIKMENYIWNKSHEGGYSENFRCVADGLAFFPPTALALVMTRPFLNLDKPPAFILEALRVDSKLREAAARKQCKDVPPFVNYAKCGFMWSKDQTIFLCTQPNGVKIRKISWLKYHL